MVTVSAYSLAKYTFVGCATEDDMNFLVEHPLGEVMVQAEVHMVRQGFHRALNSTETTQSFYRRRSGLSRVAEVLGLVKPLIVQFRASEESEERTRLSATASTPELKREIEQWVACELGGIHWSG
jgi:hypothetical protein